MIARLLGLLFFLSSFFSQAQPSVIHNVATEEAQQQLEAISSHINAGRLSQAEATTLLLLERARSEGEPLDIAAAFHELGHISSLQNKYDLALRAFNNALELYTEQGVLLPIAVVLADIGSSYRQQANYGNALNYHYRALTLFKSEDYQAGIADQQLNIGIVLKDLGQFAPALNYLKRALSTFRQQSDLASLSDALAHIGDIYLDLRQYSNSQTYFEDALRISKQLKHRHQLARSHSNLGELYLHMQQYSQATVHLNRAIMLFSELDAPRDRDWAQTTLGQVEMGLGNTQKGLQYMNEALLRARQNGYVGLENHIRLALATAFVQLDQLDTALVHANQGFEEALKRSELTNQASFLGVKVDIYVAKGDYRAAFEALSHQTDIKSQIIDNNSAMTVAQMQSEIEVERQAQSIELLQKNKAIELAKAEQTNLRTTLALGSLVAVLLFIFLLWSRYSQKRRNILLRREVRNRTQELEQKNEELQEAYRTLEQVSLRDPLTGLYNRHYLEAHLPGEIQRCQHYFATTPRSEREPNHDLLCFLLDIDNFKKINDEYGHLAGDRFLIGFTRIIHDVFRQTDLTIRWGGEEFLIICRHANRGEMNILAERFRAAVKEELFDLTEGRSIRATCSIGFCALPLYPDAPYKLDWQKTFAIMDYCLYAAKLSGKNCWVGAVAGRDTTDENQFQPGKLEERFNLANIEVATSLNNTASITWPSEAE